MITHGDTIVLQPVAKRHHMVIGQRYPYRRSRAAAPIGILLHNGEIFCPSICPSIRPSEAWLACWEAWLACREVGMACWETWLAGWPGWLGGLAGWQAWLA